MGKIFVKEMGSQIKHLPFKRLFDIIFSIIALIITLPFVLAIAIVIKATTGGKVFYAHQRIGRGGRSFRCYKFRTMYPNADQLLQELIEHCPIHRIEWEERQKFKHDPRVTNIGAFLRKTSLDELPQFWNVLKGDLSVVGPRPVVESELTKHFGVKAPKILSVRPGITGIWQVSGRNDTSYSERVRLDEKYVDKRSFFMDIKLIAKTIPVMINNKGAY